MGLAGIAANQRARKSPVTTSNDGVIFEESTTPVEETPSTETPIAVPDDIKGNSAAQSTCSNGRVD